MRDADNEWLNDKDFRSRASEVHGEARERIVEAFRDAGLTNDRMGRMAATHMMMKVARLAGNDPAYTPIVESPIEALFLLAMAPKYLRGVFEYGKFTIGPYRPDFICMPTPTADDGVTHKREWLDRMIEEGRALVVECDGHDFHERTKHQAEHDRKRDRWMLARGITVMRFTGRELWRDPFKCVDEVADWIASVGPPGDGDRPQKRDFTAVV